MRARLRTLMGDLAKRYRFHGLRKIAVNALLEVGCMTWDIAAITGQSPQMIEYYAKEARKKLAIRAVRKWESERDG